MLTSISSVCAQSCPAPCEPMDCSLAGSSVHSTFQAGILEWVAMSSSHRYRTSKITCTAGTTCSAFAGCPSAMLLTLHNPAGRKYSPPENPGARDSFLPTRAGPATESDSHRDQLSQDAESQADEKSFIYE